MSTSTRKVRKHSTRRTPPDRWTYRDQPSPAEWIAKLGIRRVFGEPVHIPPTPKFPK
jgi:hypothetical protein